MFTGLISIIGTIISFENSILQILAPPEFWNQYPIGSSIAVHGTCLTLIRIQEEIGSFMVMEETLNRTIFRSFRPKDRVHLEGSLKIGSRLDGHLLSGHIHGTLFIISRISQPDGSRILGFSLAQANKLVKYKDSIAINGVSLTISSVDSAGFQVSLIPHTISVTTLGDLRIGDRVNIELNGVNSGELDNSISPMELARLISKSGRYSAPSNPWVGAVIVKNGKIIGTGYHRRRGEAHAERNALKEIPAEIDLSDSILYSTLEPCCHQGLQPPCTDLIIKRKIGKVIIGILDPDPRVSRQGVRILEENGISVDVLDDHRIRNSLRSYLKHRLTSLPYVTVKLAITLDGKIGLPNRRVPISSPESQSITFKLRRSAQAIIIGSETALVDNPQLTIRPLPESPDLLRYRIILDRRGRSGYPANRDRINHLWESIEGYKTIVISSDQCPNEARDWFRDRGVQYLDLGTEIEILRYLGSIGILNVLIEGGREVIQSFSDRNLIDEVRLIQSPVLFPIELGNRDPPIPMPELRLEGKLKKTKIVGKDIYRIFILR